MTMKSSCHSSIQFIRFNLIIKMEGGFVVFCGHRSHLAKPKIEFCQLASSIPFHTFPFPSLCLTCQSIPIHKSFFFPFFSLKRKCEPFRIISVEFIQKFKKMRNLRRRQAIAPDQFDKADLAKALSGQFKTPK
jgi:hypothetical protein